MAKGVSKMLPFGRELLGKLPNMNTPAPGARFCHFGGLKASTQRASGWEACPHAGRENLLASLSNDLRRRSPLGTQRW